MLRLCAGALLLVVARAPFAEAADLAHALVAQYNLATNTADILGKWPPFGAGQELLTNGVLYVNGEYDPNGAVRHRLSTPEIQTIDYQSFTVGLDFYPLPERLRNRPLSPLEGRLDSWTRHYYSRIFARSDWGRRNLLTGGEAYRWIGFNRAENILHLTLNNQAFTHVFKGVRVQPNRWHRLLCSVDIPGRRIFTWFDGKPLETIKLPADFKVEVSGSSCDKTDREFTFANYSNGSMFHGYAANLRIYDRSLTESEIAGLPDSGFPSWPQTECSFPWLLSLGALLLVAVVAYWCYRRGSAGRSPVL